MKKQQIKESLIEIYYLISKGETKKAEQCILEMLQKYDVFIIKETEND